jgi:hypothetical protein
MTNRKFLLGAVAAAVLISTVFPATAANATVKHEWVTKHYSLHYSADRFIKEYEDFSYPKHTEISGPKNGPITLTSYGTDPNFPVSTDAEGHAYTAGYEGVVNVPQRVRDAMKKYGHGKVKVTQDVSALRGSGWWTYDAYLDDGYASKHEAPIKAGRHDEGWLSIPKRTKQIEAYGDIAANSRVVLKGFTVTYSYRVHR